MWIIFNNKPINVFEIKNISEVTKISDEIIETYQYFVNSRLDKFVLKTNGDGTYEPISIEEADYLNDDKDNDFFYDEWEDVHSIYDRPYFHGIQWYTYKELIENGFENKFYFFFTYGQKNLIHTSNFYPSHNGCQRKLEEFLELQNKFVATLPKFNG